MTRILITLLASLTLVACGGGGSDSVDVPAVQQCHPDTLDCMQMYASEYLHVWRVTSTDNLLFTQSQDEPAGFGALELVK